MKISPSLFHAYIKCPTKCWLRFTGESASGNTYAEWVQSQNESYCAAAIKRLQSETPQNESACCPALESTKTSKWRLGFDVVVASQNLETRLHAVERVTSEGRGKSAQFVPIRFVFTNKLGKDEKLLLAFDAFVISEMLGQEISAGKIIYGDGHSTLKIKTKTPVGEARKRIERMTVLLSSQSEPDLILNRHCGECEFQARCKQKAIEKDDLSLMGSMSAKERQELRGKGIFTVTQLSYMFRPRRRPKRLRNKREKYHHSLKALAIRQNKIHIVGRPELKIEGTPVYLDVEGLPDRDFYYLIGMRIGNGEFAVQHSLWADTVEDEVKIWQEFIAILETVEKPVLIHFGSYETNFIKQMKVRHGSPLEGSFVAKSMDSAINLVSVMFAQTYFPTYSNGLKDVAGWLAFKWSDTEAGGKQAVIWRDCWEKNRESFVKSQLVTYNDEDCKALALVTDAISKLILCRSADTTTDNKSDVVFTDDLKQPYLNRWREFSSPLSELEFVNKAAHWDYQRDRIYVRSSKRLKRLRKTAKPDAKVMWRVDKVVKGEVSRQCPRCMAKGVKRGAVRFRAITRHCLNKIAFFIAVYFFTKGSPTAAHSAKEPAQFPRKASQAHRAKLLPAAQSPK